MPIVSYEDTVPAVAYQVAKTRWFSFGPRRRDSGAVAPNRNRSAPVGLQCAEGVSQNVFGSRLPNLAKVE
jgi:hypothetical protein